MSKKDKLINRFLSRPSDFSFDELVTLIGKFGYYALKGSKTGGSRVSFTNCKGDYLRVHKPHPKSILKLYQIDDILASLSQRGLL